MDEYLIQESEQDILNQLSAIEESILDDDNIIDSLKHTKEMTLTINEKITYAQQKTQEILLIMEHFLPLAQRAVSLYFTILELQKINDMMQFSLAFFMKTFTNTLLSVSIEDQHELDKIIGRLTFNFVDNCSIALFNHEKRIFKFLIVVNILIEEKQEIRYEDFQLFTKGVPSPAPFRQIPQDLRVPQAAWNQFQAVMRQSPIFEPVSKSMFENPNYWNAFFEGTPLIEQKLPMKSASCFVKLMLVRIFRPAEIIQAVDWMIKKVLGKQILHLNPPPIYNIYEMMSIDTPLLVISKRGQNPSSIFQKIVDHLGQTDDQLQKISLGQGQGPKAQQAIDDSIVNGNWVILMNCHLGASIMPAIVKKINYLENIQDTVEPYSETFRLFLTCDVCDNIPPQILLKSIKIANEPPSGVRNSLIGLYDNHTSQSKEPIHAVYVEEHKAQLVFSMSLFHVILQERNKFGSVGFTTPYVFNESDLKNAFQTMNQLIDLYQQTPWQALRYIITGVIYGGRVTDEWDQAILEATYDTFFNPSVIQKAYTYIEGLTDLNSGTANSIYEQSEQILKMSSLDLPQMFGLNENVETLYMNKLTDKVLLSFKMVLPKMTNDAAFLHQRHAVQGLMK